MIEFVKKGLIKKGQILDICCGAGTNSIYLVKNSFSVYATDISPKAIQYAKKNSETRKSKNKSFIAEFYQFIFQ